MTATGLLTELLAAPLRAEWTLDELAEWLLATIVAHRPQAADEAAPFVIDAAAISDRQSRRLIRPLLACLATKSAQESGTPTDIYGDRLCFVRPSVTGPVWIIGEFENRQGAVRLALVRSESQPVGAGGIVGKLGRQHGSHAHPDTVEQIPLAR